MLITEYVMVEYFLAAFVIGIVIALWYRPEPTIVVKHPTPFNVGSVTHKDKQGNCYTYEDQKVNCDESSKDVIKYDFSD